MKGNDKVKLIVAVVILVAAAVMFAWYFGVFGGSGPKGGKGVATPVGGGEKVGETTGGGARSAPEGK